MTPQMELHFDQVPHILERWVVDKPITAVYFDPQKARYLSSVFLLKMKIKKIVLSKMEVNSFISARSGALYLKLNLLSLGEQIHYH